MTCIIDWHSHIFEYPNDCPYGDIDCSCCPYYEDETFLGDDNDD